ncbi:MAG TPA: hypothetical protein VGI29_04215 [Candidatus Binataceae bacterium]
MASAMQLYAAFALLVIAIVAIIAFAAIVSNVVGAVRRRFGRTARYAKSRAHDDFATSASRSRAAAEPSRPKDPSA